MRKIFAIFLSLMFLQSVEPATANAAIKLLEELGILTELTGQKKNRTFSYAAYIQLLSP